MFLGIVHSRIEVKEKESFPSKFYIPICRLLTPPSRIIKILATIFCTRLKSSNRRSSDKSSAGRSIRKERRSSKQTDWETNRESSILAPQQEIISHDRIRLLMAWIPRTERRDFQSTFTLVFEPFCYASRGPLMRSHTIHVAIVQDHCFGRTSAFRSFNERRARMSDSSRISLLFLARERRKRRYLSPFRRFRSLDPSHSFSRFLPHSTPGSASFTQVEKFHQRQKRLTNTMPSPARNQPYKWYRITDAITVAQKLLSYIDRIPSYRPLFA